MSKTFQFLSSGPCADRQIAAIRRDVIGQLMADHSGDCEGTPSAARLITISLECWWETLPDGTKRRHCKLTVSLGVA